MSVNFDTSLKKTIEFLNSNRDLFSPPITVLRYENGQITAIAKELSESSDKIWELAQKLDDMLGVYSPGKESVLIRESDLLDREELSSRVKMEDTPFEVWSIDKLFTNQDWLKPQIEEFPIPLIAGYSIKGGVGRSVALTVFAKHLSSLGKRVALIDLDLEAPGLGSLVGVESAYGVTDWLMESITDSSLDTITEDHYFRVPLLSAGSGAVFCFPAWGRDSQSYINKLGRIYLTTVSDHHEWCGLADRLHRLIQAIIRADGLSPDAIIIDIRAGLHDIGSAVVTRLGAEVMLFSRNEPQCWEGYRKLFEYLRHSTQIQWGHQEEDLRSRLKMVAAQIDHTDEAFRDFTRASFDVWLDFYDDEKEGNISTYAVEDENAPHFPTPIRYADALRDFRGWTADRSISEDIMRITFDKFCNHWTSRIGFGEEL